MTCTMLPNERVDTIMTESVLSIDAQQGASEMLRYFSTYPIHHLPVVNGPQVVGMLSTADVLKLEHMLPRTGGDSSQYLDQRLKVGSLVRRAPVTIRTSQSIEEAARLMASHAIHALAVVNPQDALVGIVTTTDIMCARLRSAAPESPNAAALEHMQARLHDLEELLRLTERYLATGQEETLHAQLLRAVERLRSVETVVS
jgi:predicted transcriptional regulator